MKGAPWNSGQETPHSCLSPPSLRYHNLHRDYIHERLQSLGKSFALRVLLVQVDVVSWVLHSGSVPTAQRGPRPPGRQGDR